jgi:hypothetical protein
MRTSLNFKKNVDTLAQHRNFRFLLGRTGPFCKLFCENWNPTGILNCNIHPRVAYMLVGSELDKDARLGSYPII